MQASLSLSFSSPFLLDSSNICIYRLPVPPSSFSTVCTVSHKKPRNSTWLNRVFTFTRFLIEVQRASSSHCIQGASTAHIANRRRNCGTTHFRSPTTVNYRPQAVDYRLRYLLLRRNWLYSNFPYSTCVASAILIKMTAGMWQTNFAK